MALTKTFEGTWDEIKLHEAEFVGHKLAVTVLADETAEIDALAPGEAFAAWVDSRDEEGSPLSHMDDSRESIYAEVGLTRGQRYKARVLANSVSGPPLPDEAFTRAGIYGDHD